MTSIMSKCNCHLCWHSYDWSWSTAWHFRNGEEKTLFFSLKEKKTVVGEVLRCTFMRTWAWFLGNFNFLVFFILGIFIKKRSVSSVFFISLLNIFIGRAFPLWHAKLIPYFKSSVKRYQQPAISSDIFLFL